MHDKLVGIAKRRAALDAEELALLRSAEELQIWRHFGMVSALDYLERKLGYAPRTARERLRVARDLAALPVMEGKLGRGELSFSAVRELSRVATPDTEAAWCAFADGKNLREIEDRVAGRGPGDRPTDPPDPRLHRRRVVLDLSPEVYARFLETQAALSDETGHRLDDDGVISALCEAALRDDTDHEPTGRAKHQIAISVCPACDQARQDGGGRAIPIDHAARERAECDAQHVGSLDGDGPDQRATQTIPPAIRRFVWRRDHGKCRVPGCRSARNLEIHHIVRRADGGTHDPMLLVLCLRVVPRGAPSRRSADRRHTATELRVSRPHDPDTAAHVGRAAARDNAHALTGMGFTAKIANLAVATATEGLPPEATTDAWLRAALQACARSSA